MVDHPSGLNTRGLGHRVQQIRLRRSMSRAALTRPGLSTSNITPSASPAEAAEAPADGQVRIKIRHATALALGALGRFDISALICRAELLDRHGPRRAAAQTWVQATDLLVEGHPAGLQQGDDDVEAPCLRFYRRALAPMGVMSYA